MVLINITNKIVLSDCVQLAGDFVSRLRGLIGRSCLKSNEALIIQPCRSVHTCFMRFPIDIIFLDKQWHILRVLENMPPYRFSPIVASAQIVIELPAGRLAATLTGVGQQLKLSEKEVL